MSRTMVFGSGGGRPGGCSGVLEAWQACSTLSARRMSPLLSRTRLSTAASSILTPSCSITWVDQPPDVGLLQRREAEAGAAGQQRGRELVRVVCDDAEARVGRILFHDAAQRHLGRRCHGVSFVEDDEFERCERRGAGLRCGGEDLLGAAERFDLLADHVDTSVV